MGAQERNMEDRERSGKYIGESEAPEEGHMYGRILDKGLHGHYWTWTDHRVAA
jgi:hypothetical protein